MWVVIEITFGILAVLAVIALLTPILSMVYDNYLDWLLDIQYNMRVKRQEKRRNRDA